jgi:tRNA threonylcarbamoyladenosine biosynthesis protein TsaB
MRVLALDTTSRAASAALVEDDRVLLECSGDPSRSHAEQLPAMLLSPLRPAGLAAPDIDVFAVAAGPGSFTGLRIGIATVQGLAFVTRRRVAPVSALEALAQAASRALPPGHLVAAWINAHRRDVFGALYRVTGAALFSPARLVEIAAPSVGDPRRMLEGWAGTHGLPAVVAGDGAVQYAHAIGDRARVPPAATLAGPVGLMAVHRARAGLTVDPAGVQPIYIRPPDAEIARDRRSPPQEAPHGRR